MRTSGVLVLMLWAGLGCGLCGCGLEEQTKKSPNSIFGKKTQNIGEFDPNAEREVSDSKVKIDTADPTAPITGPLQAYGPMVEQISKTHIAHALELFKATEDRYPNSHDEFMTRIIKANNIQLPVLPFGHQYQYDVANHQLVVVKPSAKESGPAEAGGAPAGDGPEAGAAPGAADGAPETK